VEIAGRTVVVTGAAGGIGGACSALLAERGARVVLVDRDEGLASGVLAGLPGDGHLVSGFDVADQTACSEMFSRLADERRDLAGLVNAAGIVTGGEPWPSGDLSRMMQVIAVNAGATVTLTTLAARHPVPGERAVVNISSAAAIRPHGPDPTYGLSKAGVLAFTRSAARSASGLRVNAVLPGVVRTAMLNATGVDGVAPWLAPRLGGPLLTARHVADAVLAQLVGDANGEAWSLELDPADGERVVTAVV